MLEGFTYDEPWPRDVRSFHLYYDVRQKEYDFRRTVLTTVHSRGAFSHRDLRAVSSNPNPQYGLAGAS
jgi:hypothetical protein